MTGAGGHIAVVDDDSAVREALSAVLTAWGYRTTLYPDGERLLSDGLSDEFACLVIDLRLPGIDGLGLTAAVRQRGIVTPILMMSAHADVPSAVRALQVGAQDVIEKPFDETELVGRIEMLRSAAPPESRARALFATLTRREHEVMRQVIAGNANKVIAHNLGISLKTVEMHRARVMRKTDARNLAHLVRLALLAGVGEAPDSIAPSDRFTRGQG